MYDKENVFAKIIRSELPSQKIYEDENVIVIYDINPIASVHVLLIPKGEYVDYEDFMNKASDSEIINYFKIIPKIINLLHLKENSYRLITNKGAGAGQVIFHFHTHIISGINHSKL